MGEACEHEPDVSRNERIALFEKVGCRKCGAYLGTIIPKLDGQGLSDLPGDRAEWERAHAVPATK